jgi:GNAT superfamily N-acetyltransferase
MQVTREDGYSVSDDPERIDRAWVGTWLAEQSYWATGRPRQVQERAMDHSLCFGVYAPDDSQVGFCRYVTDRATFAWLCDVFVDEAHRGSGLGVFLVEISLTHPDLAGVRRHVLVTNTAQGLYSRFGYATFDQAEAGRWMVLEQL